MIIYKSKPIASTSSIVCGRSRLTVSGQIVAKPTAKIDIAPNTTIGKCIQARV